MSRFLTTVTIVAAAAISLNGCKRRQKEAQMDSSRAMKQMITSLRGAYTAFNRGDMDAAVTAFDPEIEWTEPAEFPGGGAYHGRDEVKRYLKQSREAWAEVISEPEQFITAGERIVVFVHARVRPKGSKSPSIVSPRAWVRAFPVC